MKSRGITVARPSCSAQAPGGSTEVGAADGYRCQVLAGTGVELRRIRFITKIGSRSRRRREFLQCPDLDRHVPMSLNRRHTSVAEDQVWQ
jgi:hypothetical protein